MDGNQTDLQHFRIQVWIFGVVDNIVVIVRIYIFCEKNLFGKELTIFINWKCFSAPAIFRAVILVAFRRLHLYYCHFIIWHFYFLPMVFLPFGIFITGIFTIVHFYHRHFYHEA